MKPLQVHTVSSDGTRSGIFTGIVDDDSTVASNPAPPAPPPFILVDGCHDNPDFRGPYGYPCLSAYGPCGSFTQYGFSQEAIDMHLHNCPESCSDVTPTNRENPGEPCPGRPVIPYDTRWRHASLATSGDIVSFEFITGKGPNEEDAYAADTALDDVTWTCS